MQIFNVLYIQYIFGA